MRAVSFSWVNVDSLSFSFSIKPDACFSECEVCGAVVRNSP